MEDEKTKTEQKTEADNSHSEDKLSIVQQAAKIRDEIFKARDELRQENERQEKLQAEALLGGTTGGRVEPEPKKEIDPVEYSKKVLAGEVGDGKEKR